MADSTISASQLVAYNLKRVRQALGLSQEQAAVRLEPYLGVRWSKAVYSAAERSYGGKRVRQFTAAEVAAFALAFGVPVLYFYLPPKPDDRAADGVSIGNRRLSWPDLFEIVTGGQQRGAVQLRLDELPIPEQPGNVHALASAGIASWTRVSRSTGVVSDYDAASEQFIPREQPQPVVAGIITSGLGVLVTRRQDGNPPWGFLTGWCEVGESPEHALEREAKEEASLEVRVGERLGERDHPVTGKHMIYYAAHPAHGTDIHVGDRAEIAEVRWVGLAEADELLPGMFEPVREYLARELGDAR